MDPLYIMNFKLEGEKPPPVEVELTLSSTVREGMSFRNGQISSCHLKKGISGNK